jgi:hypothetical protein
MKTNNEKLVGYPLYSKDDTIFNNEQKGKKEMLSEDDELNDEVLKSDLMGDDLDVPGSELDDDDEILGEEDEENNYYSLGGDEHNDLDEHDT